MAQQIDIVANLLMKVDGAEAGINKLKSSLSKLKLPEGLENSFKKSFSNLDTLFAKYRSQVEKGFDTKGDVTAFNKTSKALDAELTRLSKHFTELTGKEINFKVKSDNIIQAEKQLEKLVEQKNQLGKESLKFEIKGGKDGLKDIETLLQKLQSVAGKTKTGEYAGKALDFLKVGNIQAAVGQLDKASASFKRLKQEKQDAFKDTGFDMGSAITAIVTALTGAEGKFGDVNAKISEVKSNLTNFQAEQIQDAGNYAEKLADDFSRDESAIRQADGAMQEFARSSQSMSQQLGDLQQSTQYFFSLRNMINLFKRGIDDAIQSVKELDAAMTETAVVTDYKVSDLWGMLPQYTQLANQLGATTQGAYETMTLYFQQGLDQQQAFEIGAETMKMARIAGLDYAETTDMMTAALRGFNMELNETSAKRINDVYSELAAITASDTEELGTAMQRTASIAHSAGMSFEGTTAFLAQAIETTREPAENIGTAMKTIVARFQEMKQNPLQISEVDGEEVDYNKVDAALQSIGVSLKDTNGQFRELDQVFLDISSRWDSLSQTQQRYIATVAAGSRQQSRFIAMMDNYDRTMQLFEAANNSAGASDEQFGKTMDSLESKLNKLHNAWQAFTMGIANNSMIKLAVDGVTSLLTVTNKLIDTFSLGIGPVKSLLSLLMAFTGLKAVGRMANSVIGGLGGLLDPQSSFSKGFKGGFVKNTDSNAQARAISNPIVQAIHQLQQALTGKSATVNQSNNGSGNLNTFKESNNSLRAFLQGEGKRSFNVTDAYGKISKLDDRQQASILGQLPGLTLSLKKNGIQFDTKGIKKESAELIQSFTSEINQGLKDNTISTQNAMQIFGTPENLKQALKARGPEYAKAASDIFFNQEYYQQQYDKYWSELNNDDNYLGHLGSEEAIESRTAELKAQAKQKATIDAEAKALEEFNRRAKVTQTSGAQIANSIGNIGTVAINAGQGIAQLGMQLSNAGFDTAGAAITNLGYQISSLGQIASSVGSVIGKISGAGGLGAIIAAHPVIAGLTGAALALGGAFALVQHNIQKTKDAGEQITKSFTETNKQTTDNIAKLKSYQGELASLSQGVDINGNNVSLDESQYARYLEIVDDIAAINPDIVRGYNAQGHAIIDNNTALKDTLNLQQQIQKEAYRTYLSTDSLQTLINARNVNTDYRKATKNFTSSKAEDSGKLNPNNAPLATDVRKLAKDLQFSAGFDESVLRKYGIESLDALIDGQEEAVNKFVKNQDKIQQELTNSGLQMGEDVLKGFETLGKDTQAFDEAVKPVYDNLLTSISNSSTYKELAPEMQSAIAEGLKDIASQNLSANEMESAAKALMLNFDNAFSKAEDPLNRADEALEQFTQDLDEAAYNKKAEGIAKELRNLAKEAEAVGQVEIAEWYENQASRVENALTEATYSIADGIDTLSDNISKAKSSFESLAEGIDDYYTLSDQAKGLIDTALEDKNIGGNGSKTFWRTYQGLASEEAFNRHDKDEALADMKQFQKYFAEGAEGATAFAQKIVDSQDQVIKGEGDLAGKRIKDFFEYAKDGTLQVTDAFQNLSDEQYSQLAAAFKLSDDGFTAILNNLRQWGDLDFSDPGLIRKALAVDDRSVTTNKEVSVEGQDGKVNRLYYGQSVLDAEMVDKSEAERENVVRDLEVQGSVRLPSGAEELIKAPSTLDGKDTGGLLKQFVNDTKGTSNQVQNVMAALIKSGEYNKEDLGKIHQSILDQNLLAGASDLDKSFEDVYAGAELEVTDPATEATNEHLSTISSTVSTIAGIIGADKITEGYLPEEAKQSDNLYNDLVGQLGKADTWAQLFSQGKNIENGGVITADKFTEYTDKLTEYGQKNEEYIAALKEGRENAKTPEEIDAFDAEIDKAQRNADLIATLLQNAATSFAQLQTDFTNAAETTRNTLAKIGSDSDSTPEQRKTETANALTAFAGKLEKLNFNPEQIQTAFKENFGIDLKVEGGEFATDVGEQIQQQINDLGETQINAILNIASISMPGAARGKNNTPSAIRRVGTMARGSKKHGYTISGEPTLTGELGPELVWEPRQNAAYMVGEHGPQFANLSKNAVVWNAQQTKKIKKNSKGVNLLGTGAKGIHSFGTMAGGNTGGGGTGGTTLPGVFNLDANAMVQEVTPPAEMPSIPVKANLEVEGNNGGGFLSKLFGGGKEGGPSISVAANVTSLNTTTQLQPVSVVGNLTKLNSTTETSNINATATVTRVTKSAQVAGEPISVKATATTTKVENKAPAQTKQSVGTQSMKVTADTSAAQAKIRQLINLFNKTYTLKYKASGPSSIRVPISANFTGSWKKTVEITKSGANGINNKGFGSLAQGSRYGTVGPNNRGGLTLTGEKGFEIAWLPSENRSMILGANGPQMLNLPKDAVVFTNKQSKKILNQKPIPAGSHNTTARGKDLAKYLNIGNTRGNTKTTTTNKTKTTKTNKTTTSKAPSLTAETAALSNVIVWWENIARRAESVQRKADKNQKAYEKYLKNIQATLKDTGVEGKGNEFIANTNKAIAIYTQELKRANKELQNMDIGTAEQRKAKTANKKATAAKNAFYAEQGGAVQISYSTGSGKKKKTVNKIVGTAGYIKAQDGTYVIDQTKLNTIKNKEERKALADALNKEINDRISKRNKAEDDIKKAQEALEKFGEELYDTFFAWENELTKIWNLTKKIEEAQSRTSRTSAFEELIEAQLGTGYRIADDTTIQDTLISFQNKLQSQDDVIKTRQQLLKQSQNELVKALSSTELKNDIKNVKAKLNSKGLDANQRAGYQADLKKMEEQLAIENQARQYTNFIPRADGTIGISFNTTQFEKDRANGNLTKDAGKAIQDWVKKIEELNKDFSEQYESLINEITEYQKNLEDLQEEWADYGKELTDIADDYEKQRIDKLKQLSDSIKKALDDLIDSVKRKLDERRRLEDNAKTEQEIAKKQQRLAALRADTSGGHQVEIAQLQQEIADAQQDYQRSLEDQLIDKLQQQGDEAAKQRDRQIELQEGIATSTNNIAKVNEWMANPQAYQDEIRTQYYANKNYDNVTEAEQAQIAQDFEKFYTGLLTNQDKQIELKESIDELKGALKLVKTAIENQSLTLETAKEKGLNVNDVKKQFPGVSFKEIREVGKYNLQDFIASQRSVSEMRSAGFKAEELKKANYTISQLKSGGYTATDLKDLFGLAELKANFDLKTLKAAGFDAKSLKGVGATISQLKNAGFSLAELKKNFTAAQFGAGGISYKDARNAGYTAKQLKGVKQYEKQAKAELQQAAKSAYNSAIADAHNKQNVTAAMLKNILAKASAAGYSPNKAVFDLAEGDSYGGVTWDKVIKAAKAAGYSKATIKKWRPTTNKNGAQKDFDKALSHYKKGGLADFTGPAWLDGTPSKPELVLNAADTKNFIALKDVLSRAMSSSSQINNSYGGNATYEININVDHLNNDYDVDKVVERVKKKIVSDSGYRNVTQVRKFR